MNCGIYRIRNLLNNNSYIGSSSNISTRISTHKSRLERCKHCNPHLQSAWNKYGESSFIFEILLYCDKDFLEFYEQKVMDLLHPEYNIRLLAKNNAGIVLSDITKKRIGDSLRGRKIPSSVVKRRKSLKGRPNMALAGKSRPASVREKIRKSLINHKVSENTKSILRNLFTGVPNNKNAKVYDTIVSPDGRVYKKVLNLSLFCRNHGLTQSLMSKVALGQRNHHKGWRIENKNYKDSTDIILSEVEG